MVSPPKVLLSDTWHFHERNFAALFGALKAGNIKWQANSGRKRWWKCHGDYAPFARNLATVADDLEAQGLEAAFAAAYDGLNLFEMARSELLCLLLSRPHWQNYEFSRDDRALFEHAWANDRRDLLLNLAAAQDWLKYWTDVLAEGWSHVITFSGSYIYARTLLARAQRLGIETLVAEHFFTGNDFYLEARATPIANHSTAGRAGYRHGRELPDDLDLHERLIAEMHTRFAAMANKNVKPRSMLVPPPFAKDGKTLLIIGQVMNDFSLIETRPETVFSLPVYQRLVRRVLDDSDWRIVFKAHPWERKRPHLKAPVTRDAMAQLRESLPAEQQQRFIIQEQAPIRGLFAYADQVVTICSQGGLEACQAGLKPATLGRAFYGGSGFSSDFTDADAFVVALAANEVQGTLTLEEYRAFEDYMTKTLLLDLYRNDALGQARLHGLFSCAKVDWDWPALLSSAQDGPTLPSLKDILANPCPWLRDGARWLRRRTGFQRRYSP